MGGKKKYIEMFGSFTELFNSHHRLVKLTCTENGNQLTKNDAVNVNKNNH